MIRRWFRHWTKRFNVSVWVLFLSTTEDYHTQNGNADQYVTLQQFKGCDIARMLSADSNIELTDYYLLLSASHMGM